MQNILFLTLSNVSNIDESGIYQDLLREFARRGHRIFVVSPTERRNQEKTHLIKNDNATILRVRTGNIQKTSLIEKGIATVLLEMQYISAIKKYLSDITFDLILYSTPPITLAGAVQYVKKRDGAKSYLMLKDIFPQNSVDLGMLSKSGIKGLVYKYFRYKEKSLYALSDKIGCMSQANVEYILKHNTDISSDKVEICPNCVELIDMRVSEEEKSEIRKKYDLPLDKKIFVYGGNLGRPQDVPFIVECLKACAGIEEAYFVIAGSGTDKHFLEEYVEFEKPSHVKMFGQMPKDEYDKMIACCDVGLIFLDHRFTMPNFPSRLLSYMQAGLPVLAATDPNTDVGKVIVDGGFGWWCESTDIEPFNRFLNEICTNPKLAKEKGKNARKYYETHYTSKIAYQQILDGLERVANRV